MIAERHLQPRGELRLARRSPSGTRPAAGVSFRQIIRDGFPRFGLPSEINRWRARNCWRLLGPMIRLAVLQRFAGVALVSQLRLTLNRGESGERVDFGLASMKVVTTAGVNYLVDALQGTVEPEDLKYHGFGTGTNAEASANTTLQTELTTEYVTNSTRPTGTLAEGASANIFRTVATLSPDSGGTLAITEHGVLSQAATGGGTLLDRSVFSAVNLVAGSDSLQATYELTLAAGG